MPKKKILPDPVGYAIQYRGDQFALIRLIDATEIGVYPTRDDAIAAAFADGHIPGTGATR